LDINDFKGFNASTSFLVINSRLLEILEALFLALCFFSDFDILDRLETNSISSITSTQTVTFDKLNRVVSLSRNNYRSANETSDNIPKISRIDRSHPKSVSKSIIEPKSDLKEQIHIKDLSQGQENMSKSFIELKSDLKVHEPNIEPKSDLKEHEHNKDPEQENKLKSPNVLKTPLKEHDDLNSTTTKPHSTVASTHSSPDPNNLIRSCFF